MSLSDNDININSKIYKLNNKHYIHIKRNQATILDSLYNIGGQKQYIDKYGNFRFSEHSGYLDIKNDNLVNIVVNANTYRHDEEDPDILLPLTLDTILRYKYVFHTHPRTPNIGSRIITDNVLYEFPSADDISFFVEIFNKGKAQGMIIITPEGLYLVRSHHTTKIYEPKNVVDKLADDIYLLNKSYVKKYKKFIKYKKNKSIIDYDAFHYTIARDTSFIVNYNKLIQKYYNDQLIIHYKSRYFSSSQKKWLIDGFYLPIINK